MALQKSDWKTSLCERLHLKPAEFFMALITVAALLVDIPLILHRGVALDIPGYAGISVVAVAMISGGYFYRLKNRSERIASAMICTGIFILFSATLSLFNYLMLPLGRPTIDVSLTQIDAMLGFHWPDVMAFAAQFPTTVYIMKLAYNSTMLQFAMLVVVLGLTGRARDLHTMLTSVTITATLTICFWGLFPTLGAKSMYEIPTEVWAAINPPVNREYALALIDIARNGTQFITPSEIRGMIAFPSYHAVLAFTAIYAAWNVKYIGPVFLIINLMILPGIFIHGGHHLVDLPAGFAMFLLGTWLARKAVYAEYERNNLSAFIVAR